MPQKKRNCGQLILTAGLILTHYKDLISQILVTSSPTASEKYILANPPEKISGKQLAGLAKAAQALRQIKRDFPDEISHIARMFENENIQ